MAKFLSKDGKFYMWDGKLLGYTPPMPTASLTPKTGITYTDGLPSDWNIMKEIGMAISEASDSITANTTEPIYVKKENSWAYKITSGDTINVNNHLYAVMGFNNFALTKQNHYGGTHTMAGLTFGMVDCVGKYQMNRTNTNSGGWGECLMRTSTMPSLRSGMPDTLAQVKVPYIDYDNQDVVLYSDDYMFLPAEVEVFGVWPLSPSVEGNNLSQFAYYINGGSKIKNLSGSAVWWWLRSVRYDISNDFCLVDNSGNANGNRASSSNGAAPCFCC